MTDLAATFSGVGGFNWSRRFAGHQPHARSATSAMSAREVLPVSPPTASDITPIWAGNVRRRVDELAMRPEGWDSYGACKLQRQVIAEFYEVLGSLAHAVQSEPLISLTTEGGLIASWENAQGSLEITVEPGQTPLIAYEDAIKGTEWDGPLKSSSLVEKWLWQTSVAK